MKKYELIKESKTMFAEREIYRIRALKDFGNVKAGDIGGWVCSYNNLSQEGDCWIYDNAKCLDDARVYDNAVMCGNAVMFGNAKMFDNAEMSDSSIICDNAEMCGNSKMFDNAKMFDNSIMCDNAEMCGNSKMYDTSTMCDSSTMCDNAEMFDDTEMCDNAMMFNNSKMCGNAVMFGNAKMFDNAKMSDNSIMFDNAVMCDNAEMCGRATLDKDKLLYGSINRSYKKIFQCPCEKRFLIAILTEENEILYSIGSQIGITKEKLINIIYNYCRVIDKELEEYSCRQEYLKIIDIAENYLREFI